MASTDWDILMWRRANDLLQRVERIHRNFLQIAVGSRYRVSYGKKPAWQPPINVVETEDSLWVISAIPGVAADHVNVHIDGRDLVIEGERPLPQCCKDGELKVWEIALGRFERRLTVIEETTSLSLGPVSLQNGLLIIELRKYS
jgi:HSP20 family molecular chaperone IbpA